MKVKCLFGMATLLFAALLTGCSNDDFADTAPQMLELSATVDLENEATRALYDNDDNKITATWEVNEEFAVVRADDGSYLGKAWVTQNNGASSTIAGMITPVENGTKIKLIYPFSAVNTATGQVEVDYTQQDGTLKGGNEYDKSVDDYVWTSEYCAEKYAVADSEESSLTVKGSKATMDKKVAFKNRNGICKFRFVIPEDMKDKYADDAEYMDQIYRFALVDGDGKAYFHRVFTEGKKEIYLVMEPMQQVPLYYYITVNRNKQDEDGDEYGTQELYTGSVTAIVNQGKFYDLKLHPSTRPEAEKMVDLGLTSGILWAKYNIGADTEQTDEEGNVIDGGLYFAWGETTGYKYGEEHDYNSDFSNTPYYDYEKKCWTKYTGADGKNVLDLEDDAAHVNWGGNWRMPTRDEYDNFQHEDRTADIAVRIPGTDKISGVKGQSRIAGFTNQYVFLPAAGFGEGTSYKTYQGGGYYWISSLDPATNDPDFASRGLANLGTSGDGGIGLGRNARYYGFTIRPVQELFITKK